MSKEIQSLETINDSHTEETKQKQNIFTIDELSLAYVAGGEAVVFS
jgi:hypothetical protein